MALSSLHFFSSSILPSSNLEARQGKSWNLNLSIKSQELSQNSGNNGRRIWRRRKLTKKDEKVRYKMDRIPFLEEQVRKVRESGKLLAMDIERLLLSEENRFDFVNEVAAEAKEYVDNNRDEYGSKKPILHVLSNRVNDAGFYRPEAYLESDPFKPPGYLREERI
ncbi:hypothetical protein MKW94_011183 [Papaver nudicaule]|uniref:Protein PLASTID TRANSCRIPTIONALLY ACTIVE 7 n=1 Tax=Papaver nudicaule TaxID=74823 RepID=A0AA42B5J3_PAPNU|nr:hypothetical protein [Papaver nudicaule]MCL7052200.1 hypothetical protein [Papaver nudicaule]